MEGWQIETSETEPASELGFEFTEGGVGGDKRKGNKSYNSSVITRIDYSQSEKISKNHSTDTFNYRSAFKMFRLHLSSH